MSSRIVCVLPTRNEAATIREVISSLKKELSKDSELELVKIIITDDSDDETRQYAGEFPDVEIIEGGGALGIAMYRGLKRSLYYQPDLIISLDSDGQLDMNEVHTFLKTYREAQVDLLLGSRFLKGDLIEYRYPKINRFGVIMLSSYLSWASGYKITDSHGGLRIMSPRCILNIRVAGRHTYVQETIISSARAGLRICEVESVWRERISGESRVVAHIPRYIIRTLPFIIYRAGYDLKVILPLALALLTLASYSKSALAAFVGAVCLFTALGIRILGLRGDQRDVL